MRALFDPRGVVVAGASSHPGKFGFVALHNILSQGYEGQVYATNRDGGTILGVDTVASIDELPTDAVVDLVFVCTPAAANLELLAACARRGISAAFITSAGYGEAGEQGRAAEVELVALAEQLGVLVAGPNGQGVISTPSKLCAQIVAPAPPPGRIGVASQSGNFVSSFQNYAVQTGIGISRGVSAGNAAMVERPRLPRVLRRRPRDRRRAGVRRRHSRRACVLRPLARDHAAPAVRRPEGWRHRRRPTRGRVAHGCARQRRQGVRRDVPPGRDHPRRLGRGGIRGRGHVRDTTAPAGPERRGRHHRRRLGSRHRRRDHPLARPQPRRDARRTCSPRSTRCCHHAGAATTRSTSRAARPATRSPRCSSSSPATLASTRSSTSGSASSRTRPR